MSAAYRHTVFGLDVQCAHGVAFLRNAQARATGRSLEMTVERRGTASLDWPADAETISEERARDGTVVVRIDAHPEAGYLLSGESYGAHRLTRDGQRLTCATARTRAAGWQRMLVAQVLPFAAVLRGLEVFHASAVARDGRAIAFLGPSGTGKTTLALALRQAGAEFLADDVLALECRDRELLAHPGCPIAGVAHGSNVAEDSVAIGVNERERVVRTQPAHAPAPLTAMFFLDRRDGPVQPRFEPVRDAGALLSATFNFVLADSDRLRQLLEVCALAAATCRVERILASPTVAPAALAAAVCERLREESST